ncbi:MAG: hypothetical protein MK212_16665, partial [Saprospiraceae bacterium]|nr:hypothetical protein [Saprospiraceae bacterium]
MPIILLLFCSFYFSNLAHAQSMQPSPKIGIQIPAQVSPHTPFKALLRHRAIDTIYYKIYHHVTYQELSEHFWQKDSIFHQKAPVFTSEKIALESTRNDYKFTEITLPPLAESSSYAIDIYYRNSLGKESIESVSFYVNPLEILYYNSLDSIHFYVVERQSGKAYNNWQLLGGINNQQQPQNRSISKWQKIGKLDKNGFYSMAHKDFYTKVKAPKSYRNIYGIPQDFRYELLFSDLAIQDKQGTRFIYGKKLLPLVNSFHERYRNLQKQKQQLFQDNKVHFFLDKEVYTTNNTLIHVRGFVVDKDGKNLCYKYATKKEAPPALVATLGIYNEQGEYMSGGDFN